MTTQEVLLGIAGISVYSVLVQIKAQLIMLNLKFSAQAKGLPYKMNVENHGHNTPCSRPHLPAFTLSQTVDK